MSYNLCIAGLSCYSSYLCSFPFVIFKELKQAIDQHVAVENKTSFKKYVAQMKKSGEFGDHLMLIAAASYTKFKIDVISSAPGVKKHSILPPVAAEAAEVTTTTTISHIANFHFVVLE